MVYNSSIFGKIPFLRFSFATILGIVISEYFTCNYSIVILLVAIIWILTFVLLKCFPKPLFSNKIIGLCTIITFIWGGFIYTSIYKSNQFSENLPEKAIYTGSIQSKTATQGKSFKYEISLNSASINDTTYKVHEKILLYNSDSITNSHLYQGCNIIFETQLHPIKDNNNPGEFKYKKFMENKGIRYQTFLKSNITILSIEDYSLKNQAAKIRSNLIDKYKKAGIKGDEFAVIAALTLGDKSHLNSDLKHKFSATGAMHVLAVSGLHVGILYLVLTNFLSLFRKKNHVLSGIAAILFLWTFAFITGLSTSVMRACTMLSFIIIAETLKRKTNIYNTLSLSAFILILINPLVIYEVGFQLSYAAVTSIVFFQPKIYNLLKTESKFIGYPLKLLSVSIAAQIGTFPISIFYFH